MGFKIVIPARYASARLPGKPLLKIAGKPMLEHVFARAMQSGADKVVVATDDFMVRDACKQFSAPVAMTSRKHESGTDRIAEAVKELGWSDDDIVVNLQGDEPLMPSAILRQAAGMLESDVQADVATLCTAITDAAEMQNPNIVKVVFDKTSYALYFSRAPIPWDRDESTEGIKGAYRHIGLYAYRVKVLRQLAASPPCEFEELEKLEQLRALWLGIKIKVGIAAEIPGRGVDTQEDFDYVAQIIAAGKG